MKAVKGIIQGGAE